MATNDGFASANTSEPANPADTKAQPKEKDEKYAEALAAQALLDYKMAQSAQPETKHFISKKWLIYLGISLVLTILSFLFMSGGSGQKKAQDSAQTQQLINGAQELQDAQTIN